MTDSVPVLPCVPGMRREMSGYMKAKTQNGGYAPRGHLLTEKPPVGKALTFGAPTLDNVMVQSQSEPVFDRSFNKDYAMGPETSSPDATAAAAANNSDGTVLRFFVYYQEPLEDYFESASSSTVRRCILNFYMEDATISIDEPKIANSGIDQGRFMRRTLVLKDASVNFEAGDFFIGADINIFGRVFKIVDADSATRREYDSMGMPMGGSLPYPAAPKGQQRVRNPESPSRYSKGQFFNRDRKVLRFYCTWQDDRTYGEFRDYILHYFLLNDTVEIREVFSQGRHNFPILLRRQKLPKSCYIVPNGVSGAVEQPDMQRPQFDFITHEDIKCGETINVYGRNMLVKSCDASTHRWYMDHGIDQGKLRLATDDANADGSAMHIPTYNGFGSEDDLFAMCLSLEPATTDKKVEEYNRFMAGDKKVLRYLAKLENVTGVDCQREFVINYFLADDVISVYEPPIRNSGIVGGLFLMRGKYKKHILAKDMIGNIELPVGGGKGGRGGCLSRWLVPTDFYPGAIITFEHGQTGQVLSAFKIVGYDEYTRKIVEGDRTLFPLPQVDLYTMRFAELVMSVRTNVRDYFQEQYPDGIVPVAKFEELVAGLQQLAMRELGRDEVVTPAQISELVADYASKYGGEYIMYEDFCDMLALASPRTARDQDSDRQNSQLYGYEERIFLLLRAFFSEAKLCSLRRLFRNADSSGQGFVTEETMHEVLREIKLHTILSRANTDTLRVKYDTLGNGTLDYNAFCNAVHPANFEDAVQASVARVLRYKKSDESVSGVPTLKTYLTDINDTVRTNNGDEKHQLMEAMKAFSSAFSRFQRKRLLRKLLMAHDTTNMGLTVAHAFDYAVSEVKAECFVDFDKRYQQFLIDFFFPTATSRCVYDDMLSAIFERNMSKAESVRDAGIIEGNQNRVSFRTEDDSRARDFGGTLNLFQA
uniref:DM10 domain-containing protein n=1 Tax=Phaeomonas parva TaxID=124430 RepID=A0A7S1UHB1_9STRA|mmetsp:Transcript_5468/g.15256  ORF Transcript_5468/g.15256 Transcript_5468/m.15256 type:complete len:933 (+) Transcript_5468:140-2938(+)|eukprot:CAMPEP_0118878332 /NCGR_PEP_ID=MMETSP1163-20130328/18269_1 /TAXON_ID=124430 /ORGANISM="Phaeomonas parva, Strain CCMP2877" /LENGTH=932 /DNA_ID=CAMNT_0006814141 /DNA_START=119 /DNA_END=2917 /DNA_ORIENTATION=-